MSYRFWRGASPRSGSRALLALTLALSALPHGGPAFAASKSVTFAGQLDYATFRKAAARNETVTIRYSPGGTGAAAMMLARVSKVVIDGRCNSACAWSFIRNANACFTPRASFGFHAAHDPGTGRRMNAATSYWLSSVRPSLRGRLEPLLRTSNLIKLSASDMRRYYGDRVCGSEPRTEIAAATARTKVATLVSAEAKGESRRRDAMKVAVASRSDAGALVEAAVAVAMLDIVSDLPALPLEDELFPTTSWFMPGPAPAWGQNPATVLAALGVPSDKDADERVVATVEDDPVRARMAETLHALQMVSHDIATIDTAFVGTVPDASRWFLEAPSLADLDVAREANRGWMFAALPLGRDILTAGNTHEVPDRIQTLSMLYIRNRSYV